MPATAEGEHAAFGVWHVRSRQRCSRGRPGCGRRGLSTRLRVRPLHTQMGGPSRQRGAGGSTARVRQCPWGQRLGPLPVTRFRRPCAVSIVRGWPAQPAQRQARPFAGGREQTIVPKALKASEEHLARMEHPISSLPCSVTVRLCPGRLSLTRFPWSCSSLRVCSFEMAARPPDGGATWGSLETVPFCRASSN